jgi:L-asparaginase
MRSHVVVVSTGGTIAMRYDPEKKGDVPALGGADLVAAVPGLRDLGEVEVVEFGNIPSFHMTPEIMWRLSREMESILGRPEVNGVVVTHGTDTLEETAFFLDLSLPPEKPVCVTGAMRTVGHAAPDGPYNLLCAVKSAMSASLYGYGVLVVLNGEIHAARNVTKMHTSSVATFVSPSFGPLGYVDDDVILTQPPLPRTPPLRPDRLAHCVPILKIYTGMDNALLDAVAQMRPDGLVLEGYGRGNFPASIVGPLKKILDRGIPVVAASRVPVGRTSGVYAADGGGAHVRGLGVIGSGYLNSQKARLKLLLALGVTRDVQEIACYFRDIEMVLE